MQRFDLATTPGTPWKNGGGATRELACWPPGADMEHFDWRVSVATIAQSGPFSRFPGVDRVITLLTGDGVHLRQPGTGIDHRLDQPLQPFAFAGDGGMDCDLLGATSQDFNLMARRGRWQGAVQVLRSPAVLPARPAGLLLAVRGRWAMAPLAASSGQAVVLAPDAGLWWADEDRGWSAEPESSAGDSVLLQVLLVPV
ncbi:HutD family protein [Acidovorax sp. JHL-9]|uniref:HutD/Ves family protein n=1 Tax=Acidovorax sp. JHL-9 TaxID=1276756 RepID=UPI0005513FA3|nr:HutD family protein [Acidovorax sp. JHL-9]